MNNDTKAHFRTQCSLLVKEQHRETYTETVQMILHDSVTVQWRFELISPHRLHLSMGGSYRSRASSNRCGIVDLKHIQHVA